MLNFGLFFLYSLERQSVFLGLQKAFSFCLQWSRLEALYLLLAQTTAVGSLFVSVFYWAFLAGNGDRSPDCIMKHGTNNLVLLAEVFCSRLPFVSYHWQVRLCSNFYTHLFFMPSHSISVALCRWYVRCWVHVRLVCFDVEGTSFGTQQRYLR